VNKQGVECWFEVNGEAAGAVNGNRFFRALEGANNLSLYCIDSYGVYANVSTTFNVESKQLMSCENDTTAGVYRRHFDNVTFFRDRSIRDWTGSCGEALFNSTMAVADSAPHSSGPMGVTSGMGDGILDNYHYAALSYSCEEKAGYDVGYAHLVKDGIDRKGVFRVALLFQEVKAPLQGYDYDYKNPEGNLTKWFGNFREKFENALRIANGTLNASDVNQSAAAPAQNETEEPPLNSYWRIYRYASDGDAVDKSAYMDIPYAPKDSSCNQSSKLKLQELDLTPLVMNGTSQRVDLRLALYSRKVDALIGAVEAEVSFK
jgi:hypothetical protein